MSRVDADIPSVSGYVYVLSNESLPGVLKVGMTSRDPFTRAMELRTTGVPTPFRVEFCLMTTRPAALEQALHHRFEPQRIHAGREFFRVSVREVVEAVYTLAEWPDGVTGEGAEPMLPRALLTVDYVVVRQSLNVLWAAVDTSPSPLRIDSALSLAQEALGGVSQALETLRESVERGSVSAAQALLALVVAGEVAVRPGGWQRSFLSEKATLVVWVVHAVPELRPSLADAARSLMDVGVTYTERRLGGKFAGSASWVLPSAALLLTGDLNPTDLATHLFRHPSLALEVAQDVRDNLNAPWSWRSLHVPNADYLRCLCVLRDLLHVTVMPSFPWSLPVQKWPQHTWPPEGPFLAARAEQTSLTDVVKYWTEFKM